MKLLKILFWFVLVFVVYKSCVAHAQTVEFKCKASPPIGTKNREFIEIFAYNTDKQEAEKQALWLCNKFFKTDKCKIEYCEEKK